MVRSLNNPNRLSDQLREQLSQSAAQKFLSRQNQQPTQVPDMDYLTPAIPAVSGLLQGGLQAYGNYRQGQEQQQAMAQQAEALARQLGIPMEIAQQIIAAPPQLQKQMIGQIQKEQEMQFKHQEGEFGHERAQELLGQKQQGAEQLLSRKLGAQRELEEFKLGGEKELFGMKKEGEKELEDIKHKNRLDIESLKGSFKTAKQDAIAMAKGLDDEKNILRGIKAAQSLFNTAKTIKTFDNISGIKGSNIYKKYIGGKRENEAKITQDVNEYVSAIAPRLGLTPDERKTMRDSLINQMYESPDSLVTAIKGIEETMNAANTGNLKEQIQQRRASMQQQMNGQDGAEQGEGQALNFDTNELAQKEPEQGWGEYLGRKGSIVASNAASLAGVPGDLANLGAEAVYKMGNQKEKHTGLPIGLLQNIDEMDPEMVKELQEAQKNAKPGEEPNIQAPQFPGTAAVKGLVASFLPEGYTQPKDAFDRILAETATQLPIIALTAATGGLGAAFVPALQAIGSGVAVEVVDQMGGGELEKMVARLITGYGVKKASNAYKSGGKIETQSTQDLTKIGEKIYNKVEKEGAKLKFDATPFQENLNALQPQAYGAESTLKMADQKILKEMFEEYGHLGTNPNTTYPMNQLVRYSKSIGSKAAELSTASARRIGFMMKEGIDKTFAQNASHPLVQEYNIGSNIFKSTLQLNSLEKGAKWLENTQYKGIGNSLVSTLRYLGGQTLKASGAIQRQAQYIMEHPEARQLLGEYLTNMADGNEPAGRATMMNIAKLLQSAE